MDLVTKAADSSIFGFAPGPYLLGSFRRLPMYFEFLLPRNAQLFSHLICASNFFARAALKVASIFLASEGRVKIIRFSPATGAFAIGNSVRLRLCRFAGFESRRLEFNGTQRNPEESKDSVDSQRI